MDFSVVWFKRDLRVEDHTALLGAMAEGPVLCLYLIEPSLWAAPDASPRHYQFLLESLADLDRDVQQLGGRLHWVTGEAVAVLERLFRLTPFRALHSHEETGNGLSFERDRAVARWCRERGVAWRESAQIGVVRRLGDRDRWQGLIEAQLAAPCAPAPERSGATQFLPLPWPTGPAPSAEALGLTGADAPRRQTGGRRAALQVLDSFLLERCGDYRGGISSPLSAPSACSRLSPYLAHGCLSLREVVQATRQRLARLPPGASRERLGLTGFISRLYWHSHFIQKLESEPALEYRNLHRGYDGLRDDIGGGDPAHLQALIDGRTGWPLVDACVAMLAQTGWINFRMRAMLVSVAAYPLWLHWRPVGLWLARQFVDYEPGIHWSQMQMQSGTTGINLPRIYNPLKQARDHDPRGHFVRRWLPAMRRVPDSWLFEPWRMPADIQQRCGLRVGLDIAEPVVDLEQATRVAKARLFALRASPEIKAAKAAIVARHGSRKPPETGRRVKAAATAPAQMILEF